MRDKPARTANHAPAAAEPDTLQPHWAPVTAQSARLDARRSRRGVPVPGGAKLQTPGHPVDPVQEGAPIERGGLGVRSTVARQSLEGGDVDLDAVRIKADRIPVGSDRVEPDLPEGLAEGGDRLAQGSRAWVSPRSPQSSPASRSRASGWLEFKAR